MSNSINANETGHSMLGPHPNKIKIPNRNKDREKKDWGRGWEQNKTQQRFLSAMLNILDSVVENIEILKAWNMMEAEFLM